MRTLPAIVLSCAVNTSLPSATLTLTLPAALPATLTTQAFGFRGVLSPANVVEGSNALIHN